MPYKLTDENGQTYDGCQWGENITHTATGKGSAHCSNGVIHYYEDAFQAVFANPVHGNFIKPILWEFKPKSRIGGDALKSVCKTGTTIKQLPLPTLTTEQRVEIGIRCAMVVYKNEHWLKWARRWLNGKDRTAKTAKTAHAVYITSAASHAACAAADAAAYKAAYKAAYAAKAAAYATKAGAATNAVIEIIYLVVKGDK